MNHLTKEQATTFFGILYGGEHHIPSQPKAFGSGWSVQHRGDMATYDWDMLTRLVVLSHELCVRSSIMQGGPGAVKIAIWKRDPNGTTMSTRHPTLEENIKKVKEYRWPATLPNFHEQTDKE